MSEPTLTEAMANNAEFLKLVEQGQAEMERGEFQRLEDVKHKLGDLPLRQPWRCPVCYGRGLVSPHFYNLWGASTSATFETCRSCGGVGIVWG